MRLNPLKVSAKNTKKNNAELDVYSASHSLLYSQQCTCINVCLSTSLCTCLEFSFFDLNAHALSVTIEPVAFLIFIGSGLMTPMLPQLSQMLFERTYTVRISRENLLEYELFRMTSTQRIRNTHGRTTTTRSKNTRCRGFSMRLASPFCSVLLSMHFTVRGNIFPTLHFSSSDPWADKAGCQFNMMLGLVDAQ